ncbi:MAG: hypothetical protein ABR861_07075 [Terriglobales bacterium]|jgi:hypothetical protein
MAESKRSYLLELWDKGVCPNCGKKISEGKRFGSGKKSDGGFCSLDCYGEYYKAELTERHKKAIAAAERHRNS